MAVTMLKAETLSETAAQCMMNALLDTPLRYSFYSLSALVSRSLNSRYLLNTSLHRVPGPLMALANMRSFGRAKALSFEEQTQAETVVAGKTEKWGTNPQDIDDISFMTSAPDEDDDDDEWRDGPSGVENHKWSSTRVASSRSLQSATYTCRPPLWPNR